MGDDNKRWQDRVVSAVLLLLGVAVGARVAAWLLMPLVPTLIVVAVLAFIYVLIFRYRQ